MKTSSFRLKALLLLASLLAGVHSYAQELKVVSFERLERDLIARTQERTDLNGVPCAVVRVSVKSASDYVFQGSIIGDVVYGAGEALVYMPDRTRYLTISSDRFGTLKYEFPERLEKQVAYKLSLKLVEDEDNKRRTLVLPVMGFGRATSFGMMVGVVKRTGFYAKAKYNFQGLSADYKCAANGYIATPSGVPWFNGEVLNSRLAVTGGLLQRVTMKMPLYLYGGAGYGFKRLGWQLQDGSWAENVKGTTKGLEVDLGGIYRLRNIALSAGIQTNRFRYQGRRIKIVYTPDALLICPLVCNS